jgi:hypothetical protein
MHWCALLPDYSIITTILLLSYSYHCRALIFALETEPSVSPAPFKLAIQKLNLSADLNKIKTAIKEASHFKTKDQKQALVKIALENCFCEFLNPKVFQSLSLIYLI